MGLSMQPIKDPQTNDHNRKEHEAKLAREAKKAKELKGTGAMNEHNQKEHEEKIQRESQKSI